MPQWGGSGNNMGNQRGKCSAEDQVGRHEGLM